MLNFELAKNVKKEDKGRRKKERGRRSPPTLKLRRIKGRRKKERKKLRIFRVSLG